MKEKRVTDLALIQQFREGSIEAFEELVSRYEAKVYNLAMRFTRNHEDAEEVLQDVFATIYKKIDGFQGKSAFSSWLYRVIANAAFMKLRKRKQQNTVFLEDLSPILKQHCMDHDSHASVKIESLTMGREIREVVSGAISKLPEQYRAVFVLRDVDGLSNQEVGEILELSIPAVKSRLHRSRLMLRKRLQRYYQDYSGRKVRDEKLPDDLEDFAQDEVA